MSKNIARSCKNWVSSAEKINAEYTTQSRVETRNHGGKDQKGKTMGTIKTTKWDSISVCLLCVVATKLGHKTRVQ